MHEDTRPEILARLEPLGEVGTTSRTRVPPPSKPCIGGLTSALVSSFSFFLSFFRDIYHDIRGNGDGKGTDPCNVRDFETFRELGLVASLSKLVSVIRWRATASSFASLIGRSSRIRGMSRKVGSARVVEAGRGKFYVQT